jgi:hypothetical protein
MIDFLEAHYKLLLGIIVAIIGMICWPLSKNQVTCDLYLFDFEL